MAKVTGIGGVFFKSKGDPKALAEWYSKNLGMKLEDFGGVVFEWADDHAEDKGATVWHLAAPDSGWFSAPVMINYRVDDMAGLIEQLRVNGISLQKGPEYHENGIFAWLLDPDGNKVELWQPMLWDEKNKKP